jgi:hypothetical protein
MSYKAFNGPMPTTAAQQSVTTGTAIKTMLQVAPGASKAIQIISWGYSVDDPPGADAVVELLQTDVAATVTAHNSSGVIVTDTLSATGVTLSTAGTGYTASAEGTTTAARVFDVVSLSSTTGESRLDYEYQFMPDERPIVPTSKFLRVRATTPTTAVDMRCWVSWLEL